MAKKFAVVIRKGGSGKTTTTTNVAAGLHQKGDRVLLVDIDSQANATKGVGLIPEDLAYTLNDVFAGRVGSVRDAIVTNSFGLHVLPGHRDLSQTEQGMVGNPDSLWRLKEMLAEVENDYDYIIIDTPPNEGMLTYSALLAADRAIIPVAAESFTDDGLAAAMAMIGRVQQRSNPQLTIDGILFTKTDRTQFRDVLSDDLSANYSALIYPFDVPRGTHVNHANSLGAPIVLYMPSHPAAVGYSQLVERIHSNG
jgi:chromosome partitioning protein